MIRTHAGRDYALNVQGQDNGLVPCVASLTHSLPWSLARSGEGDPGAWRPPGVRGDGHVPESSNKGFKSSFYVDFFGVAEGFSPTPVKLCHLAEC